MMRVAMVDDASLYTDRLVNGLSHEGDPKILANGMEALLEPRAFGFPQSEMLES